MRRLEVISAVQTMWSNCVYTLKSYSCIITEQYTCILSENAMCYATCGSPACISHVGYSEGAI